MNSLSFIVDENLPPHLVYWIRDKGLTATHVQYEKLGTREDAGVWQWARDHEAIVISKDEDFLNRVIVGIPPRLIWVRFGNTRKQVLIEKFEQLWPEILNAFAFGEWLVELRNADV